MVAPKSANLLHLLSKMQVKYLVILYSILYFGESAKNSTVTTYKFTLNCRCEGRRRGSIAENEREKGQNWKASSRAWSASHNLLLASYKSVRSKLLRYAPPIIH